jgi:foldase protein PrsA
VAKKFLAGALMLITFAAVLPLVAGCGSGDTLPAKDVARVGLVEITRDQFNTDLLIYKGVMAGRVPDEKSNPSAYQQFESSVLNHLVTYEMVKAKATSLNVSVTDKEVLDQIALIKANSFGGDQTKFDAALKQSGLTVEQLQIYYRELMLIQKAYVVVTQGETAPSDAEVSAYYDAHKSSYFQQETRTVRHILIIPATSGSSGAASGSSTTTVAPDDAQWAAALATAQKVRADLVGGADWKTEAAQYSNDPGSKDKGGELGTVSKGQMVAPFDQAVFSMAKDELSQPVKTVYGYHIIQVTGITPAKQQTLDEVKTTIQTTLLDAKKKTVWDAWLAKTRTELKVLIAKGLEVTTTTTASQPTTSNNPASTSTSGTDSSSTTAAPGIGSSTTAVPPSDSTTAKP